ncbi:hypothetical protein GCM10010201_35920 [Pilimelia columellifera subsp. columellifera]|uniref:Uncharacterized protein n=1 Tax=Pilimelia columellifera subsp. columellifera TaxID=706583 RepID=A0ABP6B2E5_9ACTN
MLVSSAESGCVCRPPARRAPRSVSSRYTVAPARTAHTATVSKAVRRLHTAGFTRVRNQAHRSHQATALTIGDRAWRRVGPGSSHGQYGDQRGFSRLNRENAISQAAGVPVVPAEKATDKDELIWFSRSHRWMGRSWIGARAPSGWNG